MLSIFSLSLFIFISKFNYSLFYLFYELKSLEEKSTIEFFLSPNATYTTLEIGTPPQEVNFYFTLNHHQISFTKNTCSQKRAFFPKKSTTFKEAFQIEPLQNNNNHRYIYIDTLNNYNGIVNFTIKIEIDKFPFFSLNKLNIDDNTYLCGNIGIAIMQYEIYKPEDKKLREIYDNLALYDIKRNDDFSFFNYEGKDYLIYGGQLISKFPQFFKNIKNIEYLHPSARKNTYDLYWEISMKEVYYNNVHSDPNEFITFEINPLFESIIGNKEFKENIIKDYFQYYINKDICSIDDYIKYNLEVISCQENKFNIDDIKKFPNIYISNLGLHYNFELKGEELFIKLNNKWLFGIVFPIEDLNPSRWIIGRIFLRKYPVTFSPFNRLIGFYLDKKEKKVDKEEQKIINEINEGNNKNIFSYILIILIAFIFTVVGILIGKKLFLMRRKRANELTDDFYQYDAEKKDIKNELINGTKIEMKSKLGLN